MSRVSRGTPSGQAYLDLQNEARRAGRPTQELLQLYALEGFLARLAVSKGRESFVLKGGVLLAALGSRRPTRDVDLAGLHVANDTGTVLALVRSVLLVEPSIQDGIEYLARAATAEVIREQDDYQGVRVRVKARLASADLPFHVDVNVGDPIWPSPTIVAVPRLRGGQPIQLMGYPIHMVLAEKLVTALQRGTANTRWRDFGDIWTLSRQRPIKAGDVASAIEQVAGHRNATIRPLAEVLDGFADPGQTKWSAWRRRSNADQLPERFEPVLRLVLDFADPVLTGTIDAKTWNPQTEVWE